MRLVKVFTDFLQKVSVRNSAEWCDLCYMPHNNPQQLKENYVQGQSLLTKLNERAVVKKKKGHQVKEDCQNRCGKQVDVLIKATFRVSIANVQLEGSSDIALNTKQRYV